MSRECPGLAVLKRGVGEGGGAGLDKKNPTILLSLTHAPTMKVGLCNVKIQNENDCCTPRLTSSFNIECIFNLGNITAWPRFEGVNFDILPVNKQTVSVLFWLRTWYHVQRYRDNRPLITQSFEVVYASIILLFSRNWVAGLTNEDNTASTDSCCCKLWNHENHVWFLSALSANSYTTRDRHTMRRQFIYLHIFMKLFHQDFSMNNDFTLLPFLEFFLGYSKAPVAVDHWAAPELMCLLTMTQAGCEHATHLTGSHLCATHCATAWTLTLKVLNFWKFT